MFGFGKKKKKDSPDSKAKNSETEAKQLSPEEIANIQAKADQLVKQIDALLS